MRVITGSAKGCRLRAVPGDTTRPISDLAKESLFNILGDFIVNARILDLFAGTGAVGIEALSRGAAEAVFIDKASAAVRTIHSNLQHTHLADRAVVIHTDAFKYLANPDKLPFDLIFNAPPHYQGLWLKALRAIDTSPDWLTHDPKQGGGIVVAQFHPSEYHVAPLHKLFEYDQRKYGSSTLLCFYKLIVE